MLSVLLTDPLSCREDYLAAFRRHNPGLRLVTWDDPAARDMRADVVVGWQLPDDMDALPEGTRRVICFGAGLDGLAGDPRLGQVSLGRLVDPDQARQMTDYALFACMARQQGDDRRLRNQQARHWPEPVALPPRGALKVTVLGLGRIGAHVAGALSAAGFDTHGWARSPRRIPDVTSHAGAGALDAAVQGADVVVNLLPLTGQTRGLIDATLLGRMAAGSYLVHAGRGAQLVADDLRTALDAGQIGCAFLDVFETEPLPEDHWMWHHPGVRISPHCAAIPSAEGMARALAEELAPMMPTTA